MTKPIQALCLTLAFLVCFSNCDLASDSGWSVINTPSNDDPGSCLLSLSVVVKNDSLVFTAVQSSQAAGQQNCAHQDLQFAPMFRNISSFEGNITLAAPNSSNPNVLTGTLTKTLISQFDGKACVNLKIYSGNNETWWTCRFKYGSIYFGVDWYVVNGSFDVNYKDLLFPQKIQTIESTENGVEVFRGNRSYQELVGMTYNGCGSWSNVISNLNQNIILTGTQLQSNNVDLSNYLANLTLYKIVVRSAATGNYTVWEPAAVYHPFDKAATNYCHDLGVSYAAVLNGFNCSGGCSMTLFLYTDGDLEKEYLLMNQGFSTSARLRA